MTVVTCEIKHGFKMISATLNMLENIMWSVVGIQSGYGQKGEDIGIDYSPSRSILYATV